jgi:hypothetical protein
MYHTRTVVITQLCLLSILNKLSTIIFRKKESESCVIILYFLPSRLSHETSSYTSNGYEEANDDDRDAKSDYDDQL